MTMTVRQAAGSLLVVGLAGQELTGLERAWLGLVRPGGVILFRRNIKDAPADAGAAGRNLTGYLLPPRGSLCGRRRGNGESSAEMRCAELQAAQAVAAAMRFPDPFAESAKGWGAPARMGHPGGQQLDRCWRGSMGS